MEESAKKIYEAALGTPEGHSIVVLAHNGPTGLPNYCFVQRTSKFSLLIVSSEFFVL